MLQPSSYNPAVLCGRANQCSVPGCDEPAFETHHLVHQEAANAAGAIGDGRTIHARSNLMPLCRLHHARMHASDAPDVGAEWVQTNRGVRPQVCTRVARASAPRGDVAAGPDAADAAIAAVGV